MTLYPVGQVRLIPIGREQQSRGRQGVCVFAGMAGGQATAFQHRLTQNRRRRVFPTLGRDAESKRIGGGLVDEGFEQDPLNHRHVARGHAGHTDGGNASHGIGADIGGRTPIGGIAERALPIDGVFDFVGGNQAPITDDAHMAHAPPVPIQLRSNPRANHVGIGSTGQGQGLDTVLLHATLKIGQQALRHDKHAL